MTPDEITSFVKARRINELLELHGAVIEELRERKIVRSGNGPVGDYAEFLFAKAFGWTLVNNSKKGYDAIDESKLKYQIKSRRITRHNKSRQLSSLRKLQEKHFDFLAGILFSEDYTVYRAVIIPHGIIEPRSRFSTYTNGWIFRLEDDVWSVPTARDVTAQLKSAAVKLDDGTTGLPLG